MRLLLFASLVFLGCSGSSADDLTAPPPVENTPPASATEDPPTVPPVADPPEVVTIDSGKIKGVLDGDAIVWKGIPYAAPPVGALRWKDPAPVTPWTDVRDATKFGAECIQTAPDTSQATGGSEDCLTLNVWRPKGAPPAGGWPVMFYIHGGYNIRGSSSYEIEPGKLAYDGKALVAQGVVFVSINYRVGALGWMAHSALRGESALARSGNYGALDQIEALKWVKRNAQAFGADPARVLVFGQSAGSTNTCTMVMSPLASGLLSGAMMHSGMCTARPMQMAEEAGTKLAEKLGCTSDVLTCLRAKPASEIASAMTLDFKVGGFSWGPVVDGYVLPAPPAALVAAKKHNKVPVIIGTTAHEFTTLWRSAFPAIPFPQSANDHENAMSSIFGPTYGPQVSAKYPASSYGSPALASIAATSDAYVTCPARALARALAASQDAPVRRFYFTHVMTTGPARALGAAHGFDMLFTFATYPLSQWTPTPSEKALSAEMIGYATRFAKTGDPNGGSSTAWPPYDAALDTHLVLDDTITLGTQLRTSECDFWSTL